MKVSLLCVVLMTVGLSACSLEPETINKHIIVNTQLESKLPPNCKLHSLGEYYIEPEKSFSTMPIVIVECDEAKVVTINTNPSCGKRKCPGTVVQIKHTEDMQHEL